MSKLDPKDLNDLIPDEEADFKTVLGIGHVFVLVPLILLLLNLLSRYYL